MHMSSAALGGARLGYATPSRHRKAVRVPKFHIYRLLTFKTSLKTIGTPAIVVFARGGGGENVLAVRLVSC